MSDYEYPDCEADQEIEYLIRSRYAMIYVVTWEEQRVIDSLRRVCDKDAIGIPEIHVWDSGRGLTTADGSPVASKDQLLNPEQVLDHITDEIGKEMSMGKKARTSAQPGPLYVLCDMFRYLGENEESFPEVERKLRNLASMLKYTSKFVVITSPQLRLPTGIEKSVAVVDYPLPGEPQLRACVMAIRKVLRDRKRVSDEAYGEDPEPVIRALMGLTLQEAEDALAKSIVMKDRFDVGVLNDLKRQVVRKGELLDQVFSEETMDDIGGMEGVKEYIKLRKMAFGDEARAYGIRPPKGIFLLGVQGCGKSLCAKVVANEFQVPLLKLDMGRLFSSFVGESVHPDQEIIIYGGGVARRMTMEESFLEKPTGRVSSCSASQKARTSAITEFIRHERKSRVVEVRTASGRRISVTEDHSLLGLGNDLKLCEVKPTRALIGSFIAVPVWENDVALQTEIDVLELIKKNGDVDKWFVSRAASVFSKTELAEMVGKKSLNGYLKSDTAIGLGKAMKKLDVKSTFELQPFSGDYRIKNKLAITGDLMELLGWFLAEGSDGKDDNHLSIHEKRHVLRLVRRCRFGCHCYDEKNKGTSVWVEGRGFSRVLGYLGLKNHRVPGWVFGTSLCYRRAFVRGFFDGDGGVSGSNVEATTSSRDLASDVCWLLSEMGVFSSIYPRNDGGFRICISNPKMIRRFSETIGFGLPDKKKRLAQMFSERKPRNPPAATWDSSRIPVVDKIKEAFGKQTKIRKLGNDIRADSLSTFLPEVIRWEIVWDRVVDVNAMKKQPRYVYDLSVKNDENFMCNGILCHNSENNMRRALKIAEGIAPCVLFIDELDKAFSGATGSQGDGGVTRRVIGSILDWMQEKTAPVFVVAASNSMEGIPPAVVRKGRFNERFFVDLPDEEARKNIFSIHLRKRGRDPAKFDLGLLVGASEHFSGAEVEGVVEDAMSWAFADGKREFTTKDLLDECAVCVPLFVTMREEVERLRSEKERMRPADMPLRHKPEGKGVAQSRFGKL